MNRQSNAKKQERILLDIENIVVEQVTMIGSSQLPQIILAGAHNFDERELFYENKHLFDSDVELDRCLREVCSLLNTPLWDLNVLPTSKGLIAGPIKITQANGDVLNCETSTGGVLVPQDVIGVRKFESHAKLILVVEKDAVFQKLLNNKIGDVLGPCLLLTGKGYPDTNTRLLLHRLWIELKLPVFILVDANPHGFEIMCVYRFGSKAMQTQCDKLACSGAKWVGIHPSDIVKHNIKKQKMTERDEMKTRRLLERSYVKENEELKREVCFMLDTKFKAEIEGLSSTSGLPSVTQKYLTHYYLPNKIKGSLCI